MTSIKIREIKTIEQLEQLQQVELAVWEMSPLPVHQTFTAMNHGGILLAAFVEEKMVGFLYSFAGFDGKSVYLCSHMLGILPEYRKSGLGVKMKLKQAQLAKAKGYRMITWTFDPLESKNAYLNLHQLGAKGAIYKTDYYGNLNDKLNQGLPTDRIHVHWDLYNNRKKEEHTITTDKILLTADESSKPLLLQSSSEIIDGKWFVGIPRDIQKIKKENFDLAKEWRYRTREVFLSLFEKGYQATDLIVDPEHHLVSYYVFIK